MPHVVVINEHGNQSWIERVTPADFETEHFRRCLCERLQWAVNDAHDLAPASDASVTGRERSRVTHDQPELSLVAA